jgi:hypothetical protein
MLDGEQELAEQKAREELRREQNKADFRAVLSTPEGRRVLERMVFEFGGFQEATLTPRHEGQRDVAIALDRELYLTAQDGWALMHAERLERMRLVVHDPKPNKTDQ